MMDEELARAIGKQIRTFRKKRGYTQKILSEMSGISQNYLSSIERGKSFPRVENLVALINALGCSADDLFCDVIGAGCLMKANALAEQLSALPKERQNKLCDCFAMMIEMEKG